MSSGYSDVSSYLHKETWICLFWARHWAWSGNKSLSNDLVGQLVGLGKEVNRKIAQSDHKWEKVLEEKVNALREWHGNMIYWKGQGMETNAKVLDLFQRATEKS